MDIKEALAKIKEAEQKTEVDVALARHEALEILEKAARVRCGTI
jgi:vacuolar-type H+-ATPase subunit H